MSEFGSNISTIYDDGHPMLPVNPLDTNSDWVCEKTGVRRTGEDVKEQMSKIGLELEELAMKGNVDDSEQFLEKYASLLHPIPHPCATHTPIPRFTHIHPYTHTPIHPYAHTQVWVGNVM